MTMTNISPIGPKDLIHLTTQVREKRKPVLSLVLCTTTRNWRSWDTCRVHSAATLHSHDAARLRNRCILESISQSVFAEGRTEFGLHHLTLHTNLNSIYVELLGLMHTTSFDHVTTGVECNTYCRWP